MTETASMSLSGAGGAVAGSSAAGGTGTPAPGSLGDLMATASRELSSLVHYEVELAKAELGTQAKKAGKGAGLLGAAAFLGLFAFGAITVTAAEAIISAGLPRPVGYLIVAVAYLVLAGLLALVGKKSLSKMTPPARTIETLKDTLAWARHPTTAPTTRMRSRKS